MKVGDFTTCGCGFCEGERVYKITRLDPEFCRVQWVDGQSFVVHKNDVRKAVLSAAQQLAWSLGVELKVSDL